MDALESEINTKPASNFIENFFSKLPIDSRFNKVEFQKFVPITGLSPTSKKIDFKLEKRDAPQCYLISKALIEVSVTITTADGSTLPPMAKVVASVNNPLQSLFSSVSMQINDQKITVSQEDYPYKSYVSNLLTFSADSKSSVLESQGWVSDTKRAMETTSNTGFLLRNQFWRKDMKSTSEYRKEGCTFLGKLYHDLASCDKPLPPNTRVYFELKRSSDEFYLMCSETDDTQYKAVVTSCNLYVPVAWLQLEMLRELEVRLPKETAKYHFRRWTVRQMGIPRNKSDFYSDSLFAESENPVRIFFMIVESSAYNGDYHKNAFNLGRKWSYTVAQERNVGAAVIEGNQFQQQLNQMQQVLNTLLTRTTQEPQAGPSSAERGKSPLPRKSSLPLESNSLLEKIGRLLGRRSSTSIEDEDFTVLQDSETEELLKMLREKLIAQPPAAAEPEVQRGELVEEATTKTFWLTKCQLEINSQMVDHIESTQTEDQAVQDFLRLYSTNQMINSLFTCSISYDAFMNGYHILAYDLTSSQDGGSVSFVNPSVRVGHLRARLKFSEPISTDLTLIVIGEFNSVLELNHNGIITTSYTSK
jgi:hypothetical protein